VRLALSGGGTGGHIYPALSIAAAVQRETSHNGGVEMLYLGAAGGQEEEIVKRKGILMRTVSSAPVRGKSPWEMVTNVGKLSWGVKEAREALAEFHPAVVLSTGGYAGVPVAVAARTHGIPVALYLPDLYPGWAVRAIAPLSRRICVSAAESLRRLPARRTIVTGYPVREEFRSVNRVEARARLGIEPEENVLFVAGASSGARSINKAVSLELTSLLELCEVIHVSGVRDKPWLAEIRNGLPDAARTRYHLYGYMHDDFPWAMAAADLALCRAGASVLGELPAVGLPAVLVPLPIAGGHQRPNARYLEKNGAAVILDDDDLDQMLPLVGGLIHDKARLRSMSEASHRLFRPDAADRIARVLIEMAGGRE
jgi:UDP-N-acetylglucosamine--N-acetylmuramyl-(pentapeptide) pyrophosphoryl-undecaprenol N-acetylglucosamine transferase